MIKISRFFQIIFEDPAISYEEFRLFVKDHLDRLTRLDAAGMPMAGQLTAMIGVTQPLFDTYDILMAGRVGEQMTQEVATAVKDQALTAFQKAVSQQEGLVRAKLGRNTPQYQDFFAHGVMEYTRSTLQTVKPLMENMVTKGVKYQALLGADFVAQFTALRDTFLAAQDTQGQQKGLVESIIEQRKAARAALERQTMLNVLDLAKLHLGEPDRANDYFTQSILEERAKPEEEEPDSPTPPSPPAPTP